MEVVFIHKKLSENNSEKNATAKIIIAIYLVINSDILFNLFIIVFITFALYYIIFLILIEM